MNNLKEIANLAIFIALVFVATMVIKIPIPATTGYFNVGDSMVYAAALLYGPLIGGLAGGIGASLADAIGYPIFMPGTFIIKFVEGIIVGYIGHKIRSKAGTKTVWKILPLVFGVALGTTTYYVGANYMGVFGNAFLDQLLWHIIGLFLGIFIIYTSFKQEAKISWRTVAIILGGVEMVLGYFLYENLLAVLLPSMGIVAVTEIPLNIGQALIGLTIALPIVDTVQRILPYERSTPVEQK